MNDTEIAGTFTFILFSYWFFATCIHIALICYSQHEWSKTFGRLLAFSFVFHYIDHLHQYCYLLYHEFYYCVWFLTIHVQIAFDRWHSLRWPLVCSTLLNWWTSCGKHPGDKQSIKTKIFQRSDWFWKSHLHDTQVLVLEKKRIEDRLTEDVDCKIASWSEWWRLVDIRFLCWTWVGLLVRIVRS